MQREGSERLRAPREATPEPGWGAGKRVAHENGFTGVSFPSDGGGQFIRVHQGP